MITIDEQKKEITLATAARIRYYRHLKGISQEDLALRANLNPAYFGQVERGLKCPTIDTLYKISRALGIPLSELLRFDTTQNHLEEYVARLKDLLSNIPAEKIDQVINIIEGIAKLF